MNRANRPRLSRISGSSYASKLLGRAGDGSTLTLDFTTGQLDPRLTFTRASGGTYVANDGYIYGMDFATSSSLAIGTGSKSVTLTATASVDRRYLVGQTVYISNGANNMSGPVTAYNASTQVLTINATATSGSGSFTSWSVGNASPRFDYDPTTRAPRGLLIEGTASNIMFRSQAINTSPWFNAGTMTVSETGSGSPANDATSNVVTWTNGTGAGGAWLQQNVAVSAGSLVVGNAYTWSMWLKSRGGRRVTVFAVLQGATGNREVQVNFGVSPPTVTSTITTGWTSIQAPTIVEYPNGWYKVTTGGTLPAGTTSVNFGLGNSDAVPASGTNGFEAWGYQLEEGSGASSYIPTGASTVQRLPDNCSIVSPNFAPWYGSPTGWTVVAEMTPQSRATGSFPGMLALRSAADSGLRIYYYNDGTYNTAFRFATASTSAEVFGPNGVTYGVPRKFGASVTSGTQFASSAGVQIGSTQTLAVPMDQTLLAIGSDGVSPTPTVNCRMNFRSIKYWPYAMTLADLNARTA